MSGAYEALIAELAVPHRAKHALRALLKAGGDALPAIRRGLRHENPDVRYRCCQYLDRYREAEVLDDLVAMLDDSDPRVRLGTLHTLACDRCKEGDCRPAIPMLTSGPRRSNWYRDGFTRTRRLKPPSSER